MLSTGFSLSRFHSSYSSYSKILDSAPISFFFSIRWPPKCEEIGASGEVFGAKCEVFGEKCEEFGANCEAFGESVKLCGVRFTFRFAFL
jgi:hypothetical protein